jgi:dipeptidyl aminopeptidase/acylaminoacyl peptidase
MGQDKLFTLHDLIPGGKTQRRFVPESIKQLQWSGDQYLYVKGDSMICSEPTKAEKLLFTRQQLNKALEVAGLKTVGNMPMFSVPYTNQPILAFSAKGHLIHYQYVEDQIVASYTLKSSWENYDFCPANGSLAFTEGNNVGILTPDGKQMKVTDETADGIVCGKSVHQNEFGIHKGTFWSPNGTALAFYRMDESMVTDYPLVDITARCAKAEPFKYPMAGMKSHEVTVGVYHLASGKTVWLKTGLPKEKFLTNIAWSPDEKGIYIAELNREQNEMYLVRYSALTGEKEADLFTEKDDKYVEPQYPVLFLPNNAELFIWQSRRDGYNHLYLYNTKGELLKQLTKGKWEVLEVQGFDTKAKQLFFSSTQPLPHQQMEEGDALSVNTWKLDLKKGTWSPVTTSEGNQGVHRTQISVSGKYLIDTYSAPNVPRQISIVDVQKGKEIRSLLTAKDPYKGYAMPEIVTGKIKAADGVTDLNYRLLKPVGLDETKKYPTIIYVYGGPHAQLVTGDWNNGVRGWDIYMAQRGYVVFTVDSRGSANRGQDFEDVIHRHLGVNEMADQVKGVEFLKSLPYVDADRIGVHGWSYGGFMTTNLMCSYPEIFKVGVAGGPVIDWSNYEIMYGERYMDRPQDNPEGYKQANLKLKAGNLKGHLLLIHGDIDPVVVWQHSLGFVKACIDADTYPDYFVYPRHLHNVIGKDRPHLYEKITRYFDDYLKNR